MFFLKKYFLAIQFWSRVLKIKIWRVNFVFFPIVWLVWKPRSRVIYDQEEFSNTLSQQRRTLSAAGGGRDTNMALEKEDILGLDSVSVRYY